jgi:hypothetical protein
LVCKKWTTRCKNNKNKYLPPKFIYTDHAYEEMSAKDVQMEEMMAQMASAGLSGSMYNRDDMASMIGGGMGGMGGYGDEEDEDMYGGGYGGMGGMGDYGDGMPEF